MNRRKNVNWRDSGLKEDPLFERVAWLMDESIRLGPWSIGLDGLLGLIPGVGDITGAAVSMLMIARAMQQGIARGPIIRMIINVAVDSLVGSIPLIGDIFDFAYKSNLRNLQVYREALRGERRPIKDWSFIVLVFAILLVIIAIPILGLIYLAEFLAAHIPAL